VVKTTGAAKKEKNPMAPNQRLMTDIIKILKEFSFSLSAAA
jgi:hypothetical protein